MVNFSKDRNIAKHFHHNRKWLVIGQLISILISVLHLGMAEVYLNFMGMKGMYTDFDRIYKNTAVHDNTPQCCVLRIKMKGVDKGCYQ